MSHNCLIIDLFMIRDCWNVNEMQIVFTIGCGQVTPTGGDIDSFYSENA